MKTTDTDKNARLDRELLARACEAALLSATIAAQLAGFDRLIDRLSALHIEAGDRRRELEGDDKA